MKWPRLTDALSHEKRPDRCQGCGSADRVTIWQEHDDKDKPEPLFLALCLECADKVIEPHPRLYAGVSENAPMPGAMPTCVACTLRRGMTCTHPNLKANGGPGLILKFPQPYVAMVDGTHKGKRWGGRMLLYHAPVTCTGRTLSGPTSQPATSPEPQPPATHG